LLAPDLHSILPEASDVRLTTQPYAHVEAEALGREWDYSIGSAWSGKEARASINVRPSRLERG